MKRESYPTEITSNMLAELTGKDRATVKRRLEGIEPIKKNKRSNFYDLKSSLKAIFEPFSDEEMAGEEDEFINPMLEKAKLDRARRVSVELDNKIKTKDLIPKSDLQESLGNIFGAIRSKLLNLPTKASQSLPEKATRKQLQAFLKTQVHETLKELSEKSFNESL